ncbi:hypothetical protein MSG28_006444 [Choristoneura fumiferana]|uniref:Uncharacterized protein n=1 Tax=Choristoneura fumiferana TaxID=7141 RepID=A0ACC0JEZ1_CHOFU|nr:hypothetical protein MSG28_006444 [Choristoneura fumiferana]
MSLKLRVHCIGFGAYTPHGAGGFVTLYGFLFYGADMPFQCTQCNLQINAVHPGYVATDMSSHKGPLSIDEGAAAPLWVALDADLRGAYVWYDSRVVDWDGEKPEG